MRMAVVNDALTQIDGTRTFWSDLVEWFSAEFVGGAFESLAARAAAVECDVLVRNASYWGPIETRAVQISLLQDIFTDGPQREMQQAVIRSSRAVVSNSAFTNAQYIPSLDESGRRWHVIPLPVDFSLFEPGNPMGLQQVLSLPDGCVCWIGASQGPAGHVKGYDIFLQVVRLNPDIPFVAVFKDAAPDSVPPNLRVFVRLTQEDLVKVIGACRVGLCTSRMESQHLAGIEMGACGLPMVTPPVGVYWGRGGIPGIILVQDPTPANYSSTLRWVVPTVGSKKTVGIRDYWRQEFSREIIREKWTKLIEEIESGRQTVDP